MICRFFNRTRQGYYKHQKILAQRQGRDAQVIAKVKEIRCRQTMVGVKKLHMMISPALKIGRDYMYNLLADNGMMLKVKKRHTNTSSPGNQQVTYPNLIKHTEITRPNQAWVCDITYLNTCNGFAYLSLVTDLFSRKIIGYSVSDSLMSRSSCVALEAALETAPGVEGIIHHSDHGIQYLSKEYQNILQEHGMLCSLTGNQRCYDNAVAERINGILKHELGLSRTMPSLRVAQVAAADAISIYNNERLHASLNYKTPAMAYKECTQTQPPDGHSKHVGDGRARCK